MNPSHLDLYAALLPKFAKELQLPLTSIVAVLRLLAEGNTVPFIARYRKEKTGNMDEQHIRSIQEGWQDLVSLEERRKVVLDSIAAQGKLSESLKQQILACLTKTDLEDLYLPYKPKRRTRALIAKEKGLEPLAERIRLQALQGNPLLEAEQFVSEEKGVNTVKEALDGACDIVAEWVAEKAELRAYVREVFLEEGILSVTAVKGVASPTKFEQYYNFKEPAKTIPSHRYLAIRRGEQDNILDVALEVNSEGICYTLEQRSGLKESSPFADLLKKAVRDGYKRLLAPSIETEVRVALKIGADREAVRIFAENLRHLLLAAPLGARSVIGIDPGLRTGCKCAVVDSTGRFLETVTLFPHQGERGVLEAQQQLLKLIQRHHPFAIGIGNGTAGRETETFVRDTLALAQLQQPIVVSVNEAGASVYSASDVARKEFPNLDLTIRGAISIARRLQDPLAELVKVDPKSIGVGQYQHDVQQTLLQDKLAEVVESCVNGVGVELNTASAPLLSYVAGIGPSLATQLVEFREKHGSFKSRKQLLDVPGFGPKTFEQAAGFLRVREGAHPLDASAVHPERYNLVEAMAADAAIPLTQLIANPTIINSIKLERYANADVGEATLRDILDELRKPGRDPRAEFVRPTFRHDIRSMSDLKPKMVLEGTVTNVTAFGAFVDIGVHQDGLIHLSELSDTFIKDPSEVVQVGETIKVEVISVDVERKRIALTARVGKPSKNQNPSPGISTKEKGQNRPQKESRNFSNSPFSEL